MKQRFQQNDIRSALDTLRQGGLILYPTDTIWGIGCDALNSAAIAKIYGIKERDKEKSMIVLLENENNLQSYVEEVPDVAYELIEHSERPITIVYSGAKNLPEELIGPNDTIGIRIVRDPFCQELIRRFRRPIVSTSANLSGHRSPENFGDIEQTILDQMDYIVEYGQSQMEKRLPSIIMSLDASGKFEFIRK